MNDERGSRRASTGSIIAGVFLVLLALCLILAGGGCTIFLFAMGSPLSEMVPFLLVSLAVLGAGAVAMWFGVRLIGGYYD
jgi:hypothetical protein